MTGLLLEVARTSLTIIGGLYLAALVLTILSAVFLPPVGGSGK